MAVSNTNKTPKSRAQLVAIIVAAIIAVAGIALWIYQLSAGMVNTNMRNTDSWGLYIMMFTLFVGLSAGGLIISSVPKVFGVEGFGGISKVAIWVSVCCTILAIGFVVVDLGGPARLWHLFAYGNLSSPLMWDIIVLTLYLIISLIYLWYNFRSDSGKGSATGMRVLSVFALVAAIGVHTITAWIFGLQIAHEFWYTALLGPWFVSSALLSGLALVLIVVIALRKAGYLELEESYVIKMAKLLGVFTAVDLYFFVCELLTAGYPSGAGGDLVTLLTAGPLAVFFWAEVLFGIITMAIAFIPSLRKTGLIATAATLSILAILCKRIQLILGGFQIENISYPTVITGPDLTPAGEMLASLGGSLVYVPSPLELGVVCGVLALGVFLLLVGLRLLPLRTAR